MLYCIDYYEYDFFLLNLRLVCCTDGSCQRLIYHDLEEDSRYLLGCDAVDCCKEENDGDTVEYQIPNVHPAVLAPVHYLGPKTFDRFDGVSVTADAYEWRFAIEKTTAYVTNGTGPNSAAGTSRPSN